jgi:anti-sigma-K factor RskA
VTENTHLYAGVYALDALPVDERAFFERHLATCEMCQEEVEEYAETAARLGAAVAVIPPEELRARVLGVADRTRQVAPALGSGRGPGEHLRPVLAPVAAAFAAVALTLGGMSTYLYDQNQELQAEVAVGDAQRQVVALVASGAAVRLDAPDGVRSSFVSSPDEDRGVLVVDGLPVRAAGEAYQVWLVHDGVPVPTSVFDAAADGPVVVPVPDRVAGAQQVAVTVEPAGGSAAPTGAVLISGEL